MYLQSVLASVSPNTIPEVPADTKTDEEDPPTPTELSLQVGNAIQPNLSAYLFYGHNFPSLV
ncbi:unnamed protein product [Dibothriocephalus latus]|uniref:Uncharacterized protein n=1 Tax=Dibothriocephalus latus TaxID=60516 RepID=A0A3P7QBS0_DIBLA|nr:unnamed protein product [Dibothriocephalus latus]